MRERLRCVLALMLALHLPASPNPGSVVGLPLAEALAAQETVPPPPLAERPIDFPSFEEVTLENGLRVVILPYGTQPVVSARLYVRGGAAAEPEGLAGTADLAAAVLIRGTDSRSAEEISGTIEGVGGSLSASAGQDFLVVSTTVLAEHLETGFELLGDVVRNASFPEEEVELARTRELSALQAALGQPQTIAQRRFGAVVYGPEHPYGSAPTPAAVQATQREDLLRYRDRVLQPGGALLLVAGRVDAGEAEALVRRHLGDWATSEGLSWDPPPIPERRETRIYLVHRPGSVQSVVALGHVALPPDHPDHFALTVANRILGGGSDARLFRILREEKGWTYGAYSQVTRPVDRGAFRATAEVRTEVTDSTVVELIHQVERLRSEPISDEELDAARDFLAGSFPLRLETADQVAGQLATNLLLGLPLEDLTRYPERIREVRAEDVRRAASEHLHPDRSAIVVVGDAPALLDPLEAIAPVELFDVEGRPMTREEVAGTGASPPEWDPSRLEEGIRRYDVYIQGSPMGSAEYRLEREGDEWVSTSTVSAVMTQESRLRFSADDFSPRALELRGGDGPMRTAAELVVEEGRLVGRVELPEQLGGGRDLDEPLPPGTLLPGMDEYALQASDLEEGATLRLPVFDVVQGGVSVMEARVTGREEIRVGAGSFETWRVEVAGGTDPMLLYLRVEAPHILIRQEYRAQPVRLDLSAHGSIR